MRQAGGPSVRRRLRDVYGLGERSISRLTNLGPAECLKRFLWTQHNRQHVMLRSIQSAKPAADGTVRILKVVGDQQPLWVDPFKHVQRTITAPCEVGQKGIEAAHKKGSEKRRYTVQPMFGVVLTIRRPGDGPGDDGRPAGADDYASKYYAKVEEVGRVYFCVGE